MKSKFLFLVLIAVWGSSCTATKDSRAVKRVKANIDLLNDVGNDWQKLHPCTIDTIVNYVQGKEFITYDTVYSHELQHDTINNVDLQTKVITVTKNVHDTVRVYVTDTRALQTVKDDFNNLQGQFTQQTTELTATKKSNNKWMWLFIAACAFILIENILGVFIYFRSKVKV